MPTLTLTSTATTDDINIHCTDAYDDSWNVSTSLTEARFGVENYNHSWWLNRFTLSEALPASAVITSATIQYRGAAFFGDNTYLRLFVTANSNPNAPTSASQRPSMDGGSSTLYPATFNSGVRWPSSGNVSWNASGANTTTSFASLIQYLVDTYGGLANGAHIVVWCAGYTDGETLEYSEYDIYDNTSSSYRPVLTLTYSTPATYTLNANEGAYNVTSTSVTFTKYDAPVYTFNTGVGVYTLATTLVALYTTGSSFIVNPGIVSVVGTAVDWFKYLMLECGVGIISVEAPSVSISRLIVPIGFLTTLTAKSKTFSITAKQR